MKFLQNSLNSTTDFPLEYCNKDLRDIYAFIIVKASEEEEEASISKAENSVSYLPLPL